MKSESKEYLHELLLDIKEQLERVKLEINEKKTCIVALSHGFTYMQVKYNIVGNKIIRRPTHAKIVRERKRLKKYRTKLDEGVMSLLDIHNAYRSWRNSLLKDCPQSKKSIYCMDKLFHELFPEPKPIVERRTREELIKEILEDKEVRKCTKSNYQTAQNLKLIST